MSHQLLHGKQRAEATVLGNDSRYVANIIEQGWLIARRLRNCNALMIHSCDGIIHRSLSSYLDINLHWRSYINGAGLPAFERKQERHCSRTKRRGTLRGQICFRIECGKWAPSLHSSSFNRPWLLVRAITTLPSWPCSLNWKSFHFPTQIGSIWIWHFVPAMNISGCLIWNVVF